MAEALQVSIDTSGAVTALKNLGDALATNLSNFANATKPIQNLSRSLSIFGKNSENISKGISSTFATMASPDFAKSIADINKSFAGFGDTTKYINQFATGMSRLNKMGQDTTAFGMAAAKASTFVKQLMSSISNETLARFNQLSNSVWRLSAGLQLLSKNASSTKKTLVDMDSSLKPLAISFKSIFTAFAGGTIIYSTVRAIKDAFKATVDLELIMRRVNTIARVSDSELGNMRDTVQDLSSNFGIASSDIAQALYEINSAAIVGKDAMVVLKSATQLAAAGFSDVTPVAELLSRALNAYNLPVTEATHLSDVLFKTVERGINTMKELAQYEGRLFTVAATSGVGFEDLNAAVATLTARGLQTNIAITSLNAAIMKIAGGTKELDDIFIKLGFDGSSAALRMRGLKFVMDEINRATKGNQQDIQALGFNYRDVRAVTILANDAFGQFATNLKLITDKNNTAGASAAAFAEKQKALGQVMNEFTSTVANATIDLVQLVLELFKVKEIFLGLTSSIKTVVDFIKSLSDTNKFLLKGIILVSSAIIITQGLYLTWTIATSNLTKKVWGLVTALTAQAAAQNAVNASSTGSITKNVTNIPAILSLDLFKKSTWVTALTGVGKLLSSLKGVASLSFAGVVASITAIGLSAYSVADSLNIANMFNKGLQSNIDASDVLSYTKRFNQLRKELDTLAPGSEQFKKTASAMTNIIDKVSKIGEVGQQASISMKNSMQNIEKSISNTQEAIETETASIARLKKEISDIEFSMKFDKASLAEQRDYFLGMYNSIMKEAKLSTLVGLSTDSTAYLNFVKEALPYLKKANDITDTLNRKAQDLSESFKEAFAPQGSTPTEKFDIASKNIKVLIEELKGLGTPSSILQALNNINFDRPQSGIEALIASFKDLTSEEQMAKLKKLLDSLKNMTVSPEMIYDASKKLKEMALEAMPQSQRESYLRREYNKAKEAYGTEIARAGGETVKSLDLQNQMMTLAQTINGLSSNVKEMAPAVRTLTGVEMGTKEAMDILSKTANVDFNKETAGNTAKLLDVNKDMRTTQTKILGKVTTGFMPAGN